VSRPARCCRCSAHTAGSNTLVALPTGLGKTFIAAVVILNYFNWFPQGKSACGSADAMQPLLMPAPAVIFVAPTRPLVSQQQMACHGICGLPWDVAVEMTGATRAALRGDEVGTGCMRCFGLPPLTAPGSGSPSASST